MLRTTLVLLALAVAVQAAAPAFPQSFTTEMTDALFINQGGYQDGNNVCCATKAGQCKVQVEEEAGIQYVDAVNQRVRFDPYGTDQSIVTLYKQGKQYLIQNNTCQSYCPLQDNDWVSFGPPANATDKGKVKVNGVECTDYQWKETILGIVVMEISDFFADDKNTPVQEIDQLTPFGQKIGQSTTVFANFKAGMPDASHWDIQGMDNCQESQNCNSNEKLTRDLIRNKLWKTWAHRQYASQKVAQKRVHDLAAKNAEL